MKYKLNNISSDDLERINELRFNAKNTTLKKRAMIIFAILNNKGTIDRNNLAQQIDVNVDTITTTVKGFNEYGLDYLQTLNRYKKISELDQYKDKIKEEFTENPPKSANDARLKIKEITGLDKHVNTIKKWLKKTGIPIKKEKQSQQKRTNNNNSYSWRLN